MMIENDRALDIAVGNSRKTKTWKNKSMQWSELLDKLGAVTRTSETMAEYKAMKRDQQADVKDVGGFVGGFCNQGSRSDVRFRSVLCLDADYADDELWEDWKLLYGHAAAVYSTHKHTPEKPRLRLVVPLSRNVTPDEYQAIGRRVADTLGIDKFDDTTYQAQRVMFWPSCSTDGEFVFEFTDGEFLDPDKVLNTYVDWCDVSSWPMSSRVAEVVKKEATKQQDPLSKPGLIGAFCRAYTIHEAIAQFIPEYEPCDDGRYTYTEGSTAAGIVIYDDKFSYSHHATDPASMQLCNAWDVVRLHRYHELDEDCDPDTPMTKRPSYQAMCDLATADKKVVAQSVSDRMAEAEEAFNTPLEEGEDWRGLLKVKKDGSPEATIENLVTILKYDPLLSGRIAYDEMQRNIVILDKLPWTKGSCPVQWVDNDDSELRRYIERNHQIASRDKLYDAVSCVAFEAAFHPVRDYLDSCEWDGVPRLDTLFVDYLGAEDNEYVRTVTRKTMVGAVARIYNPGCKFDYILTLRGKQGKGKSSFILKLGGKWASDSFSGAEGKTAYEQLLGVWIMEVGELSGLKKAEVETIKHFITKQSDRFRPAYGRRIQEFPRQCIFFASTNESQFLRDTTGNRRWWIVDTPNDTKTSHWDTLTPEMLKQVWGEAVQRYKDGETLYLTPEMEAVAREVQEIYEEENPNVGIVADYLDRLLPENWKAMDIYERRNWLEGKNTGTVQRQTVCALEIWVEALGMNRERFDRYRSKDVRDIMAKLPDWKHQGKALVTTGPYGRQKYYARRPQT